ncbi:MAG: hypothetical protein LBR10_13735 [Prevotellaceae bacterium]|jgi:hypothetical protein|nr:hypothetical protein [Prevotellaceae bacterium]
MKTHLLKHVVLGLTVAAAFGAIVMLLWNVLMPAIFGVSAINIWQALGLLVLSRILFGGFGYGRFGGGFGHFAGKNPIREKWMKMTPEERKEFMRHRHFGHGFGHDFCDRNEPEKKD